MQGVNIMFVAWPVKPLRVPGLRSHSMDASVNPLTVVCGYFYHCVGHMPHMPIENMPMRSHEAPPRPINFPLKAQQGSLCTDPSYPNNLFTKNHEERYLTCPFDVRRCCHTNSSLAKCTQA
jgi:hypothetical protein